MKISFRTKEESKRIQENDFLKLSPVERFYSFVRLMYMLKDFPSKKTGKDKNFVIQIDCENNSLGKSN